MNVLYLYLLYNITLVAGRVCICVNVWIYLESSGGLVHFSNEVFSYCCMKTYIFHDQIRNFLTCRTWSSALLQAVRALMIVGIVLGAIGCLVAIFALKCLKMGNMEDNVKATMTLTAGIMFLLAGTGASFPASGSVVAADRRVSFALCCPQVSVASLECRPLPTWLCRVFNSQHIPAVASVCTEEPTWVDSREPWLQGERQIMND